MAFSLKSRSNPLAMQMPIHNIINWIFLQNLRKTSVRILRIQGRIMHHDDDRPPVRKFCAFLKRQLQPDTFPMVYLFILRCEVFPAAGTDPSSCSAHNA